MKFSATLNLSASIALHQSTNISRYIPKHNMVPDKYIDDINEFLKDKMKVLVLTGAGISTESGIPDYRSEGVGMYARTNNRPIQHIDFLRSESTRKRYWARNFIAWPTFSNFQPNATHLALAQFEQEGRLCGLITQNVDQLHHKAGSKNVLELHGHGYSVVCVGKSNQSKHNCDYRIDRHSFQQRCQLLNEHTVHPNSDDVILRPDGDIDISSEYIESFRIPECQKCGGNMKPDVVFFGDNVPKYRIQRIENLQQSSDCLLVLGSSLQILSGYRIVVNSHEMGVPVVIVNIGPTRADHVASIKLSAKCGDVVPKLFTSY